jgi:hypothetical protein
MRRALAGASHCGLHSALRMSDFPAASEALLGTRKAELAVPTLLCSCWRCCCTLHAVFVQVVVTEGTTAAGVGRHLRRRGENAAS